MTTTTTITWHLVDERPQGREDSAWYTYSSAHNAVCTVSNGDREITVHADGEMRVIVRTGDGQDDYAIVNYCDDWEFFGISNDEDIVSAHDAGRIDWVNNSWFDLYTNDHSVGEYGWLNCVNHTLSDAIAQATAMLS